MIRNSKRSGRRGRKAERERGEGAAAAQPAPETAEERRLREECEEKERQERERKEREQQVREGAWPLEDNKETQRDFEKGKEEEIKAVIKSLQTAAMKKTVIPLDPVTGNKYYLYSVDHVNHCYDDPYHMKWIRFFDKLNLDDQPVRDKVTGKIMTCAHVAFDSVNYCDIDAFLAPEEGSRTLHRLGGGGNYKWSDLVTQFLGDDHLTIRIKSKVAFGKKEPPADTPLYFEYVGFRVDEETAARQLQDDIWHKNKVNPKKILRGRSASPRDSWFERNHPMGSWNEHKWHRFY
ncbi:hypothetical protein FDECE_3 [Fusarium decemcellulare]|nr:hypothetical protein FDECE_3 [Fusarium decemcellulare]